MTSGVEDSITTKIRFLFTAILGEKEGGKMKELRAIQISKLKDFLKQDWIKDDWFIAVYAPECTLKLLDENKKIHEGSLYLREEVNI
jgi:hypothetical protein